MLHQLDVGGNAFGSLCTAATDPFEEPRPFRPVKIAESGRVRPDILDILPSRSRLTDSWRSTRAPRSPATSSPGGGSDVIAERAETYAAVLKKMIDEADVRFRERLRTIPDGKWRHVEHVDKAAIGDDRIHKLQLTLTKEGERLTFDTTGTDPQVGILNCSHGGFRAGTLFPILQYLCFDLPWASSGMLRNIDYVSEKATIVHAEPPGLVSCAGATGIYLSMNLAQQCVSKMLLASDELRDEAVAMNMSSWTLMMLSGTSQYGDPMLAFMMDPMAGAVGARATRTASTRGGIIHSPQSQEPEVALRAAIPAPLPLPARGAGHGRRRALARRHRDRDRLHAPRRAGPDHHPTLANGVAFPNNQGLAGGYPGGTIRYRMQRGSKAKEFFAGGGSRPRRRTSAAARRRSTSRGSPTRRPTTSSSSNPPPRVATATRWSASRSGSRPTSPTAT